MFLLCLFFLLVGREHSCLVLHLYRYDLPRCGDFCHKPFYKKQEYLDLMNSIKFEFTSLLYARHKFTRDQGGAADKENTDICADICEVVSDVKVEVDVDFLQRRTLPCCS